MARGRKKRRKLSKTLTQRVNALEKAIMPKKRGKRTRVHVVAAPQASRDFTPPHIRRQLGL